MTRTQNGITCEIDNDGASRWATFCTGKELTYVQYSKTLIR